MSFPWAARPGPLFRHFTPLPGPRVYTLSLDLPDLLRALANKGITCLLVEGGPSIAASFVSADLVDEVALLRGPITIGVDGIDALEGLPLDALVSSAHLRASGTEVIGADILSHFERTSCSQAS